mmetsp:Transcript_12924/g.42641  ORF Transcript_12924/g.42641 Transcript_12924/m.42641 type:complete len:393 (+) Transcript_12924:335-1513(+)
MTMSSAPRGPASALRRYSSGDGKNASSPSVIPMPSRTPDAFCAAAKETAASAASVICPIGAVGAIDPRRIAATLGGPLSPSLAANERSRRGGSLVPKTISAAVVDAEAVFEEALLPPPGAAAAAVMVPMSASGDDDEFAAGSGNEMEMLPRRMMQKVSGNSPACRKLCSGGTLTCLISAARAVTHSEGTPRKKGHATRMSVITRRSSRVRSSGAISRKCRHRKLIPNTLWLVMSFRHASCESIKSSAPSSNTSVVDASSLNRDALSSPNESPGLSAPRLNPKFGIRPGSVISSSGLSMVELRYWMLPKFVLCAGDSVESRYSSPTPASRMHTASIFCPCRTATVRALNRRNRKSWHIAKRSGFGTSLKKLVCASVWTRAGTSATLALPWLRN